MNAGQYCRAAQYQLDQSEHVAKLRTLLTQVDLTQVGGRSEKLRVMLSDMLAQRNAFIVVRYLSPNSDVAKVVGSILVDEQSYPIGTNEPIAVQPCIPHKLAADVVHEQARAEPIELTLEPGQIKTVKVCKNGSTQKYEVVESAD
jgi:hypothetical protein